MIKLFSPKCTFGDDKTKDEEAMEQEGERPVGEVFDFRGVKLQVVEEPTCNGCFFSDQCIFHVQEFIGQCGSLSRFDRKSVIFKLIN